MVNRVTGLASGLDTEALVKQMMALSQSRYDNIMKKKTETEWKKQLYNDIYNEMNNLHTKLFDASLSSFTSPKTVTSSNESIATVTAGSNASNVNHTLTVKSLASGASMTSSANITSGANKNTLKEQLGLDFDTAEITISSSSGSKTITVDTSKSISSLVQQINESGMGLKATYDSNTDRLFINSTSMGEASSFTLSATGADGNANANGKKLLNSLNLLKQGETDVAKADGKDAEIVLDGTTFFQNSNDFSIAGMTFSLKAADKNQELRISVKTDNSKLLENVKDIVKSYNNLLELINGKTSEKYYRDYAPLTQEQKDEMTEKEIELWEEKAKSGLLRNDSILTSLASNMRTAMYSSYKVEGNFKTMASIGISTTNYQDKGKLSIDENKFLKALEEDPDAVSKLFSGENGLINTLRSDIKKSMTQMTQKSGAGNSVDTQSSWAKEITKYSDQLDILSAKMVVEENRYYTQFATLEKTISSMNSSSSYLTSMFGS